MKGSNVLLYLSKQTYDVYNYKVLESEGQHNVTLKLVTSYDLSVFHP